MQIWGRRAKSSDQAAGTIIDNDIGWKKEGKSCPNNERNELCVAMVIKMKDDKSSLQTFGIGIFTFNQIIAYLSGTVTV